MNKWTSLICMMEHYFSDWEMYFYPFSFTINHFKGECILDTLSFGRHVKMARKRKGMTADELANTLNINQKSVWQIEGGKRTTTLSSFVKLCNALEASPEYFLSKDLNADIKNADSEYMKSFDLLLKLTPSELARITDIMTITIENRKKYR